MVELKKSFFFRFVRKVLANATVVAFLVSLFISTVLWFLYALDRDYSTKIPYKVEIRNIPEGKILKNPFPESLSLIVNAKGWDLLKIRFSHDQIPLEIDMRDYKGKKYILTNQFKKSTGFHKYSSVKIVQVNPDTLFISIDDMGEKQVPVKADLDLICKKQYGISGETKVAPEFVLISGPKSYLRKIDTLSTIHYAESDLKKDFSQDLRLVSLESKNISASVKDVEVFVPVEKLTEGHVTLPVKIHHSNTDYRLIPDKVTITYQCPVSLFTQINEKSFEVYVDPDSPENHGSFKVFYSFSGKYIYRVRTEPEYIDYIFEK